ncbi:MAG TPA: FAD-dependent oxidoreductase, partial [Gammaproteobacteria bacterium]|nr:FAD-dependent oxidoreductase [Gammaproteobacteria bacterium]
MKKSLFNADFVVIGAGIIGLSIARELKRRYRDSRVILLEKEEKIAEHASGRNSGVLHAGFYYSADSLKAKLTREGNRRLTAYCLEKKIPLNCCGKLVVARQEEDRRGLHELLKRARLNGIPLELISDKEAKEIEPRVKTYQEALFSPTTASVSPRRVVEQLVADARAEGIDLLLGVKYVGKRGPLLQTNQGSCEAGYVVNAAGLYADRVAKSFSFSK